MTSIQWLPSSEESELLGLANEGAKLATWQGALPQIQTPWMKSTMLNIARSKRNVTSLPEKIGKYSKRIDKALLGKHTRQLYDRLSWREASILA